MRTLMHKLTIALTLTGLLIVATPAAAVVIPNVHIEDVSSELTGAFTFARGTINQRGLDGSNLHGNTTNTMWLNAGSGDTDPIITYRLPQIYSPLSNFHLWNYNEAGFPGCCSDRGFNHAEIYVSPTFSTGGLVKLITNGSGTTDNGTGDFAFPQAPGTAGYAGLNVDLSSVTNMPASVGLVRVRMLTDHGNGSFRGLAEVEFETASLPAGPTAGAQIPISSLSIKDVSSVNSGRVAENTINDSGLTGGGHNIDPNDMWLSNEADPVITYDLGSTQSLGGIHVWHYNENAANGSPTEVDIYVSPDDNVANLVFLGQFVSPGDPPKTAGYTGFDLDLRTAVLSLLDDVRLVRFDILNNWDGAVRTGLSEVQFFNQGNVIPEPSALALCVLGLTGFGMVARRRTRK